MAFPDSSAHPRQYQTDSPEMLFRDRLADLKTTHSRSWERGEERMGGDFAPWRFSFSLWKSSLISTIIGMPSPRACWLSGGSGFGLTIFSIRNVPSTHKEPVMPILQCLARAFQTQVEMSINSAWRARNACPYSHGMRV